MRLLSRLMGRKPDAVVSFPKSGRTWLRVMLDELAVELHYTHAGAGHSEARHFSELDLSQADDFGRIVLLHRDPRDTVVSGYYQVDRRKGGYPGTISEFIRDPRHGIEKIVRYNAMWQALAAQRGSMLVLAYEDLRADPHAGLSRVLGFLNQPADQSAVAETIGNNTFERMQARERAGHYQKQYGGALAPRNLADPDSFKVRRGMVGGFRNELTAEDIAYCDQVMADWVGAPTNAPG